MTSFAANARLAARFVPPNTDTMTPAQRRNHCDLTVKHLTEGMLVGEEDVVTEIGMSFEYHKEEADVGLSGGYVMTLCIDILTGEEFNLSDEEAQTYCEQHGCR